MIAIKHGGVRPHSCPPVICPSETGYLSVGDRSIASGREPLQVAKRTLVLGAIAFRASLEVTDNSRTVELSGRLLPWLREVNCDDEIDPIERDLLDTPLGCLGPSLRIDANCAGEAAAYFCWTLGMAGPLPVVEPADQAQLLERLSILTPEAAAILQSPSIRDREEIRDVCRHYVLVRSRLQEIRMGPPASNIIRRGHLESHLTSARTPNHWYVANLRE